MTRGCPPPLRLGSDPAHLHTDGPSSIASQRAAFRAPRPLSAILARRTLPNATYSRRGDEGEGRPYILAHATVVPWLEAQEGTAEDLRSRGASVFMQAAALMGMPRGPASLNTRPPLARRPNRGSHDTVDDELARPSRAADYASRSERACRRFGRSRAFTLDEGGAQGVVCSCVAAVDVVRQLSRRRLGSRLCGRPRRGGLASATRVRVWAAASGRVRSRVMGGDRVGRHLGGAYAPLGTSLNLPL